LRFKRKDKLHFSWDVYAYVKRIFAYLSFGETFSIKNFLNDVQNNDAGKRKKLVLTDKIGYELRDLQNRHGTI